MVALPVQRNSNYHSQLSLSNSVTVPRNHIQLHMVQGCQCQYAKAAVSCSYISDTKNRWVTVSVTARLRPSSKMLNIYTVTPTLYAYLSFPSLSLTTCRVFSETLLLVFPGVKVLHLQQHYSCRNCLPGFDCLTIGDNVRISIPSVASFVVLVLHYCYSFIGTFKILS